MRRTRLKPISDKQKARLNEYNKLVDWLRELDGNVSMLSNKTPDWQTGYKTEYHHIYGRTGQLLMNPFNLIPLVRDEHNEVSLMSKQTLADIVQAKRVLQGFKPEDYGEV